MEPAPSLRKLPCTPPVGLVGTWTLRTSRHDPTVFFYWYNSHTGQSVLPETRGVKRPRLDVSETPAGRPPGLESPAEPPTRGVSQAPAAPAELLVAATAAGQFAHCVLQTPVAEHPVGPSAEPPAQGVSQTAAALAACAAVPPVAEPPVAEAPAVAGAWQRTICGACEGLGFYYYHCETGERRADHPNPGRGGAPGRILRSTIFTTRPRGRCRHAGLTSCERCLAASLVPQDVQEARLVCCRVRDVMGPCFQLM